MPPEPQPASRASSAVLNRASPLWAQVHRLPAADRQSVAALIVGYDFCRSKVERDLVTPLRAVEGRRPAPLNQLVDEALLGVLRSSVIPRTGRGVVPDHLARALPDLLGALACAAASNHAGRSRGRLLEQTGYSFHPGLARRQVLTVWAELAGLTPEMLDALEAGGFALRWEDLTTSLLEGLLTGLSRAGTDTLLAHAEHVARHQPPYLKAALQDLVASA
jgi:hypothetical protein